MRETKDRSHIRVIDVLNSNPSGLTAQDISGRTGLPNDSVLKYLAQLIKDNRVDSKKAGKSTAYFSKEKITKPAGNGVKLTVLEEKHIKKIKAPSKTKALKKAKINVSDVRKKIFEELKSGKIEEKQAQIKEQRIPLGHIFEAPQKSKKFPSKEYVRTGIEGLDALIEKGIPKGTTILVAGGAGSGKTILCLQILNYHAKHGEKCLYMSFEESENRLREHMHDFGWDPEALEKKGSLKIQRFNPFDITRSVDALLMKAKGELLIEVDPVILPQGFKPDFIVVDSLTAIASAFTGKEDSYRIYIEQLFLFFEKIGATAFLVTETKQVPTVFSTTGVEEFLADGVFVLYSITRGNVSEYAAEVLKLRGARHHKKIVAMQITDNGIFIYPEQEVFGAIESSK